MNPIGVLFVDDERHLLDGLRDGLRRHRKRWDMAFALGGREALDELDRRPFDMVISDMRMPGIDGATLLEQVKARQPRAYRVILSGFSETDAAIRALAVADNFLHKPCDLASLENVIERCDNLRRLLADPRLRAATGGIDQLPALPMLASELLAVLARPRASSADVARALGDENSRIPRVNGLPGRSGRVEEAAAYLGSEMIRILALSLDVFRPEPVAEGLVEALSRHAVTTARIAAAVAPPERISEAFVAGMLHDVGGLVLGTFDRPGEPPGGGHAELGAYLLGLWNVPYPIVEAVAYHHAPRKVAQVQADLITAVHVADLLANDPEAELDASYLERLGLGARVRAWRDLARGAAA